MQGDRARLRELVIEQEARGVGAPAAGDGGGTDAGDGTPPPAAGAPHETDSDQAQANLERMLETGEENPIS